MTNVNTTFAALPIAASITGAEILPVDQGGTTKQTTTGAIGALASVGQFTSTFVTVTANPILVNSRIMAVSSNLSLTDGGALGNLTIGTGALSGDVTSAANSFVTTVAKINGVALGATTATAGNILIGSGAAWVTNPVTGDISLTAGGSVTVGAINGSALGVTTPTAANLLIGSGTHWVTQAITGDISITAAGLVAVNSVHGGVFANPTGTIGLIAVNGALTTAMRSDAAPALSQAIAPTWTAQHIHNNAAGTSLVVQGGGASNANAAISIAPTAASLTQGIVLTQSVTGTNVASLLWNTFTISTDDVAITGANNGATGWQFLHNYGGTNLRGGRQAVLVAANFSAASNAANTNHNYVGLQVNMQPLAGDNGTNTAGGAQGAFFGIGVQATTVAGSSATNFLELTGGEIDVALATTCTAKYKFGWSVVSLGTDKVSGAAEDAGYQLGAAAGSIGFNNGFWLSTANGAFPIKSTGTVLGSAAGTVDHGIDLSALTITTAAFRSPGFTVGGTGTITSNNTITVSVSTGGNAYNNVVTNSTAFDAAYVMQNGTTTSFFGFLPSGGGVSGDWTFYSGGIQAALTKNGALTTSSGITAYSTTPAPTNGTTGLGYKFTNATNFGIFFGSSLPTLSAAQGSFYLRTEGASSATRAYINANGTTGWTPILTSS